MKCSVCPRELVIPTTCCRPLCHEHAFDPDAHELTCQAPGLCDVCQDWAVGVENCCGLELCADCMVKLTNHQPSCARDLFQAPPEAA